LTRFSVIIPCRNAAAYIDKALDSVRAQTHPPHEVIVIDDGSSDSSGERVAAHAGVRLLATGGLGVSAARNAGIEAARGDYLAFLDADDRWAPGHLARAASLIGNAQPAGLINHRRYIEHATGAMIDRQPEVDTVLRAHGLEPFIDFYCRYGHFTGMSACITRTDRTMEIGGFDPALPRGEDLDFWLRLIDGEDWIFDPEPTTLYRLGTPGALSADVVSFTLCRLTAFAKVRPQLHGHAAYDDLLARIARRGLRRTFRDSDASLWRAMFAASAPFLPSRARLGWRLARAVPQSRKLLSALDML
jgi:glycosyltransferase involved in cell wall biosynthesis